MAARMLDADSIPQLNDGPSVTPEMAKLLTSVAGGFKDAAKARGMYLYYRQPNGDITLSPGYMTDLLRYMQEGWIPLSKYGYVKLCERYQDNPYEPLLQRGGAAEFTKEQANELRFHLTPVVVPHCNLTVGQVESFAYQMNRGYEDPIAGKLHKHDETCFDYTQPIEFPQFQAGFPESYSCDFCGDVATSPKGRQSHIMVMHRDQLAAASTAQALANAIKATQLTAS